MPIEEIWVCRVDIAGLHCDHIRNELRCRSHRGLEEIDNNTVKALTQRRIPTERLLSTHEARFRGWRIYYNQRTHYFREELAKNADKLIIDELAAFKRRLIKSLDLLLYNDFKRSCPNEEGRCRALVSISARDENVQAFHTNR